MTRRVAIVGLGLLGGSLGLALRARVPGIEVLGVGRRLETADAALRLGAVDRAGTDLALLRDAELVVLACPLWSTAQVLEEAVPHLAEGCRVTDVGSVKAGVVAHALTVLDPGRNPFLGGHPMAGKVVTGIDHAEADLFKGRPWVLTPQDGPLPGGWEDYVEAIEAIGAVPLLTTPEDHDRSVAMISHLPFLLSAAYLASMAEDVAWPSASELASSGFRDISRLGAGNPEMYAAIVAANRDEVLRSLAGLRAVLDRFETLIEEDSGDRVSEFFEVARATRDRWAADHPHLA
ncbi:MAG: prephenate dehydrogenase [Candidatus Dormibacteria bacterium]